jgi:alanine racemase
MNCRTWVEIDGRALRGNLQALRRASGSAQIIAVVKANAYGHGIVPVARECARWGVERLAVATVAEGTALRRAGLRKPILVLSPALREEYAEAIGHKLELTLSNLKEAQELARLGKKMWRLAFAQLQVDTGMGWLGVWHSEAAGLIQRLQKLDGLELRGFYTHFARAAEKNSAMTHAQWNLFFALRRQFPRLYAHAANTHAVCRDFAADAVRPGIGLYGAAHVSAPVGLRPVLSWKARITQVRTVPAGRTVSYGATYKTRRQTTLATVAAGYADGYPRLASNTGFVLVNGRQCPVCGRVAMDQMVVDVTGAGVVRAGQTAVLIGRMGRKSISAHDLAGWAQTISYEILAGIGPRVLRVYLHFKTV